MQSSTTRKAKSWQHWRLPILLAMAALLLALLGEGASELLRYDRVALSHGELWRLLTAHLVHLGWLHLLLNIVALLLLWALVGEALTALGWLLLSMVSALFISGALWFFNVQLQWYVGLSGLLHGMMFAGALVLFGRGERTGGGLGLLVMVKLVWEQLFGPLPGSEAAAGGMVIVQAHLYGAVAGGLFATVVWRLPGWRKRLVAPPPPR